MTEHEAEYYADKILEKTESFGKKVNSEYLKTLRLRVKSKKSLKNFYAKRIVNNLIDKWLD
jgi:hypothetical protein